MDKHQDSGTELVITKSIRKRNFTHDERALLVTLVQDDKKTGNILFGKFSTKISKKKKSDKWGSIASELNKINGKNMIEVETTAKKVSKSLC